MTKRIIERGLLIESCQSVDGSLDDGRCSDHGTEYKGQCQDMLEKDIVKVAPGGVNVHTP